jgi:hypothetical protein
MHKKYDNEHDMQGWEMHEDIGMGIVNPGSCTTVTKPDWMSAADFLEIISAWAGRNDLIIKDGKTLCLNNEDAEEFKKFIETL